MLSNDKTFMVLRQSIISFLVFKSSGLTYALDFLLGDVDIFESIKVLK